MEDAKMEGTARTAVLPVLGKNIVIVCESEFERRFVRIFEQEGWETDLFQFLAAHAPGRVFIDIGAYVGWTAIFALLSGATKCHAFEPDDIAHESLVRNVELNGLRDKLRVHHYGLLPTAGERRLYKRFAFGDSASSVFDADDIVEGRTRTESTAAKFRAFKDVVPEIRDAGVVKCDIEGAEYLIYKDLLGFCRDRKAYLALSLHPHVLGRKVFKLLGLYKILSQMIGATVYLPEPVVLSWANFIPVARRFRSGRGDILAKFD